MDTKLSVLVTGATGKQGGAVARRLLARGHRVRALTRKTDSPGAKALTKAGAEVVAGNLEERASLDAALPGMDAIFSMSTGYEAGLQAETRQGITTADAAKAAGVHLVYTSVGDANRDTGIPHFDSKHEVEKHIRKIGVPATLIAPAYFMDNAVAFGREQLKQGVFATPLGPERKLAQIAVSDIAAVAVVVMEQRDRFLGKRFDIAGDEVSGNQVAAILSRVTGRKFSYFQVPMEMVRQRMGDDAARMFEYFEREGYHVDFAALKRDFPEVEWHTYEGWAKVQDWKAILG
jgi:uncharacterized protein YbjT (DUF2867 family)